MVLTPGRHLRDPKASLPAAFETNHYAALVFGRYIDRFGLDDTCFFLRFEGLDFTGRTLADGMDRLQIRADGFRFKTCYVMHQVKPVGSYIRDCSQLAAFFGQNAPVVVGRAEKPVLNVTAAYRVDIPHLACPHHLSRLKA